MKKTGLACSVVALAVLLGSAGSAFAQTVHDVRDFGARCDGVTDDNAALKRALDTVAGGNLPPKTAPQRDIVLVPAGVTCATTMLFVPSFTELHIEGQIRGKLRVPTDPNVPEHVLVIADASDVHIWGLGQINAAKAVQAGIFAIRSARLTIDGGLTITNSIVWPVNIQSSDTITISGVTLSNGGASPECTGDQTTGRKTTACHVDHLTVRNIADGCWAFYGGVSDGRITDSDLAGCLIGIQVLSDGSQQLGNENILIYNNHVHDNEGYGIQVLSFLVAAIQTGVTIDHNEVDHNKGGGIALTDRVQNATIKANTIHDDANDPCARFTSGFVGGIVVNGPAAIRDNIIQSEGGVHPGTGILFNLGLSDTVTLTGNSISNVTYAYVGSIGPNVSIDATNSVVNVAHPAPKQAALGFFNGSWVGYSFGLPGDIPFSGDLNLDGTGDHVPVSIVYRPSEANWYIDMVSGGSWTPNTTRIVQFGLPAQSGQPGDYPELVYYGGIAHIAVYRPSTGQTFVNTDNQSYHGNNVLDVTGDPILGVAPSRPYTPKQDGEWPGFTFGLAGDIPFEMRLTAGGPLSPVVYRPWEANWYVATGRSGSPAGLAQPALQFGLANDDLPRVVSYGGVDHIAVYRCSTGQLLVDKDNKTYALDGSNTLVWPSP